MTLYMHMYMCMYMYMYMCKCECKCKCKCKYKCKCKCKCKCTCTCTCTCTCVKVYVYAHMYMFSTFHNGFMSFATSLIYIYIYIYTSYIYLYVCYHQSSRKPQHSKWNCVGTNRQRHIHMNTPKIRILQKNNLRNDQNRIRICQLIPKKNPEIVRIGFGRNRNTQWSPSSSSNVLSSISWTSSSSDTCSSIGLTAREVTLPAWENPFLLMLPFSPTCSAHTLQLLFRSALKRPSTNS